MLLNRCPVTAGSWIVFLLCAEVLTKPVNGRGGAVCADVTSRERRSLRTCGWVLLFSFICGNIS